MAVSRTLDIMTDSFLDGVTGAAFFGKLRRPGAPTAFADLSSARSAEFSLQVDIERVAEQDRDSLRRSMLGIEFLLHSLATAGALVLTASTAEIVNFALFPSQAMKDWGLGATATMLIAFILFSLILRKKIAELRELASRKQGVPDDQEGKFSRSKS
jgi:hypothetical protein